MVWALLDFWELWELWELGNFDNLRILGTLGTLGTWELCILKFGEPPSLAETVGHGWVLPLCVPHAFDLCLITHSRSQRRNCRALCIIHIINNDSSRMARQAKFVISVWSGWNQNCTIRYRSVQLLSETVVYIQWTVAFDVKSLIQMTLGVIPEPVLAVCLVPSASLLNHAYPPANFQPLDTNMTLAGKTLETGWRTRIFIKKLPQAWLLGTTIATRLNTTVIWKCCMLLLKWAVQKIHELRAQRFTWNRNVKLFQLVA